MLRQILECKYLATAVINKLRVIFVLSLYYSDVSYQLILNVTNQDVCAEIENQNICGGVERELEAIEFSIRSNTSGGGQWIPLRLTYHDSDRNNRTRNKSIRGYATQVHRDQSPMPTEQVSICGDILLSSEVQFRWVGTANGDRFISDAHRSDMWALASVNVILTTQNESIVLIQDNFGSTKLK